MQGHTGSCGLDVRFDHLIYSASRLPSHDNTTSLESPTAYFVPSKADQLLTPAAGTKGDRNRYRMSQAFKQVIEEKRLHDEWKRNKRQCTITN